MSLSEEQIVEIESLLSEIETTIDRCHKELLKQFEAEKSYNNYWERALQIPENDSDEWRTLDRIHRSAMDWWQVSNTGYVVSSNCEHFEKIRAALKQLLQEHEPEFLRSQKRPKDQLFFAAGEKYKAKKAIFNTMNQAKTSLVVVDQYLDETIFDYLESIDNNVQVKLLTGQIKPIFKMLYEPFATERGNIQARMCTECHDRFILLDNEKAVHLGTSINHAGEKAFMINKVTDVDEFNRLLNEFNSWWAKGQPIM